MDVWDGFIDQLRPLLRRNDKAIIRKLTRKFFATSLEFQSNVHTVELLKHYIDRIRASPFQIYIILLELKRKFANNESFTNENRLQTDGGRHYFRKSPPLLDTIDLSVSSQDIPKRRVNFITLTEPNPSDPIRHRCSEKTRPSAIITHGKPKRPRIDESGTPLDESAEASTIPKPKLVNSNGKRGPLTQRETESPSPSSHLKLQILQHRMEIISRMIRQLEEAEMDVTELGQEESAYLRLDSLKREHLALWRQFCRLRGISRHAGSLSRLPFRYSGSSFAVINQAVEHRVNASHVFPDYANIHKVVEESSIRENLGLSASTIETLAREIFTDVGAILKRRREREFRHDFGCHLTDEQADADEDPALHSAELRRRLLENRRIATSKIESVIAKYSRLQESQENREASRPCENKGSYAATVDLDAVEFVDVVEEPVGLPSSESFSSFSQSEEIPLPISSPDANIESPVFMDDLDLDVEEHLSQAQVEMEEEVPPVECPSTPTSTITISDDEDEDEPQVVFCGYPPPPKDFPAMHTLMSGDQTSLQLSYGGCLVISRSQRHVLQPIPTMEMIRQ
ncbi:Daxx protein [Echinococcus multilocularis]|uniref:Daxx protein n=1 Tax=Echinococcus multilocularis TaxID=6211 RepID=A0A068Y363_ECHMU|nr:Daxx protein [Echinococcus multilocularis]